MKIERKDFAAFYAVCVFVTIIAKGFMAIPEYPAGSEASLAFIMGLISLALIVAVILYALTWGALKLNDNRNNVA